jgi:hypothetical protein
MSKTIFSFMLLASLVLSGCASMQPDLSPAQRLFALQAEYNALQEVAADYCESPNVIPEVKNSIKRIDQDIYQVFQKVRTGRMTAFDAIPQIENAIRAISNKIKKPTITGKEVDYANRNRFKFSDQGFRCSDQRLKFG